jgi:hypothetical protein
MGIDGISNDIDHLKANTFVAEDAYIMTLRMIEESASCLKIVSCENRLIYLVYTLSKEPHC